MTYAHTPAGLTEYTIDRPSCTIHYWVGGPADQPVVVLMHGATMDHRMFNPQVEDLLPDYRVLVWDAPGHGKSQPLQGAFTLTQAGQDMFAILDAQGIDRAVIGGQSLGSLIAQQMYLDDPSRFLALIAIGGVRITKQTSKLERWALKASLPLFKLWPHKNLTKVVARATVKEPLAQAYALEASRQLTPETFAEVWAGVGAALPEGLEEHTIDVPILITHGDQDRAGTIKRDAPAWAKHEPDATYVVIPNAAHNANQDNPEFTNRAIRDFLQRTLQKA
ncbi:MAG: alpha/beta fold hydrolase [Chloroflexi bacterium]|nr:alpha/beta fold hydrolase [Chloroflexota bacterium]